MEIIKIPIWEGSPLQGQTAGADNIRYQVLLASEEAAGKLRNSVAGMSGDPPMGLGPAEERQLQKPM